MRLENKKYSKKLTKTKSDDCKEMQQPGLNYSVLLWVIKVLVFISLFTPLIVIEDFFFPFVAPKSLFFMAVTQLLFAAYILLSVRAPEFRPKFNCVTISFLAYLAVMILTTITSIHPSTSFWSNHERMTGLLMWLHMVAYFIVITSVFKTYNAWRNVFITTLTASNVVASIFLADRFGLIDWPISNAGSTLGNSSFMGTYLLFNAFIALYAISKQKDKLSPYFIISLVFNLAALFVSDARASQGSFLGGLVLIFIFFLMFKPRQKYLKIFAFSLLALSFLVTMTVTIMLFIPDSYVRQIFIRMATEARLTTWSLTVRAIAERLFFGWGPENYSVAFLRYFDPRLYLHEHGGEVWFDRAHNIVLDTLISSGVIGLLAYLSMFATSIFLLWKKYLLKKLDFWTASIFSVVLISYFIQNLTVFDMVSSYLMFILVLAYITSVTQSEKSTFVQRTITLKPIVIFLVTLFLLISMTFSVVMPFRTGVYISHSRTPASFSRLLHYYRTAIDSSHLGREIVRTHLANSFLMFLNTPEAQTSDIRDIEKVLRFLELELQKNIAEFPRFYRSYIGLSSLYNVWARQDSSKAYRAVNILNYALALSPDNQIGYWQLAQAHLHLQNYSEAILSAQKAVDLEPRHLHSHIVLIESIVASGDLNFAEEKIIEATNVNPAFESRLREILP